MKLFYFILCILFYIVSFDYIWFCFIICKDLFFFFFFFFFLFFNKFYSYFNIISFTFQIIHTPLTPIYNPRNQSPKKTSLTRAYPTPRQNRKTLKFRRNLAPSSSINTFVALCVVARRNDRRFMLKLECFLLSVF